MRNVFVVDDHPFLRMGVRSYLEKNFKDIILTEADSRKTAETVMESVLFDYAFIDISLGEEDGLELAALLKQKQPSCRVIILSMHKEPLLVERAKELNLDGYIIKEDAFDQLETIMESGETGEFVISKKLEEAIAVFGSYESTGTLIARYNSLTSREQTIFRLLAEGLNYKEIGYRLGIKHKTVLVHRYNLMKKLVASDQTEIVRCAVKLGLIDL